MKLAISTGVWKRPEVFELFARGVHKIEQEFVNQCDIITIVAGSEGEQSKTMVEKHGFKYVEMPNQPLAEKFNMTLTMAKIYQVDYVLCLGSDDIIHPDLFDVYLKAMQRGVDYIGFLDMYFWDTVSNKSAYWGGYRESYREGCTAGAGRCLSARVLNEWDWKIWENKHNDVLDTSFDEKLRSTKHSRSILRLKDWGLYALDIKSSTNMTPFKLWDNTRYVDTEPLLKEFGYLWK